VPTLLERIAARHITVGVVGLGYVGLPLAVGFAEAGVDVIGFDVDAGKVAGLSAGRSHVEDVPSEAVAKLVEAGLFEATTDFERLKACDCISICVPTPLGKSREPDIGYILRAVQSVRATLRPGQLIVLESTTWPGTTLEVVGPALQSGGLKLGTDIHLAFSPERIDPGNATYGLRNTPKVVGGATPDCTLAAAALYGLVADHVVTVSNPTAAEMVKLIENTFRAVNIGLVNEMALISSKLDVDVWEILAAAATKPFGYMPFSPGPGLGGHCIPIDPHYLSWKLRSLNYRARFIELADEVNSFMPDWVVTRVSDALNRDRKSINGTRILVLGVAYKRDIADWRESPAIPIIRTLRDKGAHVEYADSHVPMLHLDEHGDASASPASTLRALPLDYARLDQWDCVVVVTDHSDIDREKLLENARLIVDTRNLLGDAGRRDPRVFGLT
jgi:UDP-N-acetyl-D-glucosamine dehydrogenase